jgi:hypothetical protein
LVPRFLSAAPPYQDAFQVNILGSVVLKRSRFCRKGASRKPPGGTFMI